MNEENKEEMNIAIAWIAEIKCKCPYCNEEQETISEPGETETCLYCNKEFEIGDFL